MLNPKLDSKWLYATTVVMLVLIVLYFAGRKTFHASIVIKAEPEAVWSVLMDTDAYAKWHPLLVPQQGEFVAGESIKYLMTSPQGNQTEFDTKILIVEPQKHLKQHAGMPLILTADHEYRLTKVPGGTQVIQHEEDNGIAMLFWDSSWVEPMYRQVNKALEQRVLELQKP